MQKTAKPKPVLVRCYKSNMPKAFHNNGLKLHYFNTYMAFGILNDNDYFNIRATAGHVIRLYDCTVYSTACHPLQQMVFTLC